MNRKVRVLTLIVAMAVLTGGGLVTRAADWLPWGRSNAAPTPAEAPAVAQQASSATPTSGADGLPSFADIASRAEPAVVNISTSQTVKNEGMRGFGPPGQGPSPFGPNGPNDPFEEFFRRYAPQMPKSYKQRSLGSGFLISTDGMIVTNNHVVEHADEILVKLSGSDHQYKAKVLGTDPKTDVALVKIEPKGDIPVLRLGDSD